jgi:CRP/FNR family transcriptional regulator, anaerobic regulatory protein
MLRTSRPAQRAFPTLAHRLQRPSGPARRPTADNLAAYNRIRRPQAIAAGDTFVDEGAPAFDVFMVATGVVKLFKLLTDGRRQIVGFLVPGEIFGFAPSATYPAGAQAINSVTLWRISRRRLERLFAESPDVERQFLDRLVRDLERARDQIMLLGRKTAHERVASFLLELARRQRNHDDSVDLPMTRIDIGDYLGLTMETVSRAFTALKGTGCIAMDCATKLHILDTDALTELAEGLSDGDD